MKKNYKIITAFMMTLVIGTGGIAGNLPNNRSVYGASYDVREHVIAKGTSATQNPLKGMFGYSESSNYSFPHSMEWFYIPVSDVQTDMNTFNWTKLENRLNDVASRGHQAVFRFYYDYPGEGNGVPQFVKDRGLTMRYYNEPNDLGGSGYCPDYENEYFRQSMQTFISAFGAKYDGDGRIGFITVGLLGFWGEWHNWPYDEDTSDGKPDWSISTTVYNEVINAFDDAFDKTKICVREPKSGINFRGFNVGYHDDSFGYATLSMANGGQDWSFMQKLINAGVSEKWKSECIGGEIYPPSQGMIFSGNAGDYQDWTKCLNESHATWMLNESIKSYSGTSRTRAEAAAHSLGYDLQVDKAYFADYVRSGENISLKVDIKNIGTAPFYYGHDIWPVQIGIKNGTGFTNVITTDWDLNSIPANSTNVSFNQSLLANIPAGDYELCMKVKNPIASGVPLSFANADQSGDGWLKLGNITVTADEASTSENVSESVSEATSENNVIPIEIPTYEGDVTIGGGVVLKNGYGAWYDNENVYLHMPYDVASSANHIQYYVDSDGDSNTGYKAYNGGFEYLVEDGALYRYTGTNNNWNFEYIGEYATNITYMGGYICIEKSLLNLTTVTPHAVLRTVDDTWTDDTVYDIIPIQEKQGPFIKESDELRIEGYQISYLGEGVRTIYTVPNSIDGKQVTEVGMVYGIDIDTNYRSEDMRVGSDNPYVKSFKATANGRLAGSTYETGNRKCYVMTMKFVANTAEEFDMFYYVRPYVKLSDGTYVYSSINGFTPYSIAASMIRWNNYGTYECYDYLLNSIIRIVNPNYDPNFQPVLQ